MKKFTNKNVLITGGSSGIGLATAKAFLQDGANVWITGRNKQVLEEIKADINSEKFNILVSDTSNLKDIDKIVDILENKNIKLDSVFLNAGIAKFNSISLTTEEEFDAQFNTNVKGAFFTLQKIIPLLNENSNVTINGSTNATASGIGSSIYSATKSAIIKIAKIAANELAPEKIRVNVISPGPTLTNGLKGVVPNEALDYLAGNTAVQRLANPEEIAKAVLFISSDDAAFITGTELVVDGGLLTYSMK